MILQRLPDRRKLPPECIGEGMFVSRITRKLTLRRLLMQEKNRLRLDPR